jgi:hypothetical protein
MDLLMHKRFGVALIFLRMRSGARDGEARLHETWKGSQGLGGRTPAEAAGIKVEGENRWLTLIQNA